MLEGQDRETFADRHDELTEAGVPAPLARRVASMPALLSVFDIVEDATGTGRAPELVMDVYFQIGARLGVDWLRDRILELPRADRWQALARAALRDDLYRLHRALTREVLLTESAAHGSRERDRGLDAGHGARRRPDRQRPGGREGIGQL